MNANLKKAILIGLLILTGLTFTNAETLSIRALPDSSSQKELDDDWKNLIEEIGENSEEDAEKWEELLDELVENPIPINTASKEQLESIPFLSAELVESLSYYLYRYGPVVSLSELLLVEGMNDQTFRWLQKVVYIDKANPIQEKVTWKKVLNFGKHEMRQLWGRSIQQKAGFRSDPDSIQNEKKYLGDPNRFVFRYGFNYKNKVQWGVVVEKDAGETWWKKSKPDYSSFHIALNNQGRIKQLIVGDYELKLGQGLVCSKSFSLGKNLTQTALEVSGVTLSRHFSTAETGFFRGIGTTFVLKPFFWEKNKQKSKKSVEMTLFASIRKVDGEVSGGQFSSISISELHRTDQEFRMKDQIRTSTEGFHFTVKTSNGQMGFSGLIYRFNAELNPNLKPYNSFYFRGKKGSNVSTDYRFRWNGILFFGEMALDEEGKKAGIWGLSFKPHSRLDLSMLYRNYAKDFHSYYGKAFSEGSYTSNESGVFAIIEWRFIKNWRLNAYCDVFSFPWLKYGVDAPTSGTDIALQTSYNVTPNTLILFRYKSKNKAINQAAIFEKNSDVETLQKNQFRMQLSTIQGSWSLKTVVEGNFVKRESSRKKTKGMAASQELNYKPRTAKISGSIQYHLFDTDSFENRVYIYEKDLPGFFSMSALEGIGNRIGFLLKYQPTKKFQIEIKIRHSTYEDRDAVGTGLEQVLGNHLTDIRTMFSWKF